MLSCDFCNQRTLWLYTHWMQGIAFELLWNLSKSVECKNAILIRQLFLVCIEVGKCRQIIQSKSLKLFWLLYSSALYFVKDKLDKTSTTCQTCGEHLCGKHSVLICEPCTNKFKPKTQVNEQDAMRGWLSNLNVICL